MKKFTHFAPALMKKARALRHLIAQEAPTAICGLSVGFDLSNLEQEGFQGSYFQPWRPRKTRDPRGRDLTRYKRGCRAGKLTAFGRREKGRALLVKSGALRAGFHWRRLGAGKVAIYNNQGYALLHNRGARYLPQRKMLGRSPVLERQVAQYLKPQIQKILRK